MHVRIYLLTFLTTFALSSSLEADSFDDDFTEVEDTLRSEALRGADDFDIEDAFDLPDDDFGLSDDVEKCPGSPLTENDPNLSENLWTNCKGTYIWDDGDKYVGEWKDDKRHGQGIYTGASGILYVGEWKDGVIHGQGSLTASSGDKYVGEWKDSKMNGTGTYTWANGSLYVGEWKDDKRHGQGIYTDAQGAGYPDVYKEAYGYIKEGVWEADKIVSYGKAESEEEKIIKIAEEIPFIEGCEKAYLMKGEDAQRLVSHQSEEIKKAISEGKVSGDTVNEAIFKNEQFLDSMGGMGGMGQDGKAACEIFTMTSVSLKKPKKRF